MGLHLEVDRLRLAPRVPDEWESYKIHYRYRETFYHITLDARWSAEWQPRPLRSRLAPGRSR